MCFSCQGVSESAGVAREEVGGKGPREGGGGEGAGGGSR